MNSNQPQISSIDCAKFCDLIPWKRFDFAILEAPWETTFLQVTGPLGNAESYESGLLFGATAELRWKRLRGGLFRLVCMDDEGCSLDGATSNQSLTPIPDAEHIVLWGEPQTDISTPEWYEPRIPRVITEYPPSLIHKRVCVRIARYKLEVDCEPVRHLYRCAQLQEFLPSGGTI